jgi:2-polyprenyl-3-methyl-5-hydroxy-6-metoxy-1,4-benzoquinol methylase
MNNQKIVDYYDPLLATYLESGINDRIYDLYKRLLGLGLKPGSNVLELGSGIGTLTFLLSKYVKDGKIEAVDLSPKFIEFSRQKIKRPNITFVADDVVTYQPSAKNFDYITLFDIIEHIPIEKHNDLFHNLAGMLNENTKVLINIPNPAYLEYDRIHNPEALQIVDQPLPLGLILENLEKNGMTLTYFETYSVWVENDYQFIVIEKKRVFEEVKLSSKRNIFQKIRKKLETTYIKFRYNFF